MAPTKIKFVVSFSSQDKVHKVSNLLTEDSKRWLSDPQDRSGQVEAVFQLEQLCHLAYIDIGVIWCANIEVRVGRSDWPQGQTYVPLVPLQTLMSPIDCRLGRNTVRTCMFSKAQFREGGSQGKWDRIQVVCRQPWRKDVQIGLSFLRIRSSDNGGSASERSAAPENSVGGKPAAQKSSVADIQKHFFGNKTDETKNGHNNGLKQRLLKIASTAENGIEHPEALPRVARMMLKANQVGTLPGPPGHHDDASCLFSSSVEQQAPGFSEEVMKFLETLDIKKEDIDSLKVSDLRHKFEKIKWRKLIPEEKRSFYACCQDFIGQLFEDNDTNTGQLFEDSDTNTGQCFSSPSHGGCSNKSSKRSKQRDDSNRKGHTISPKNLRGCDAGSSKNSSAGELKERLPKAPICKENDSCSGGFLRKDVQLLQSAASPHKASNIGSEGCATPKTTKWSDSEDKSPASGKVLCQNTNIDCTLNNPSSFHSSGRASGLTGISPKQRSLQKSTALSSPSVKKRKDHSGEHGGKSSFSSKNKSSSSASPSLSSNKTSSKLPDSISTTSGMHSALLSSLKHFVDARVSTISSPVPCPSSSATAADSASQSPKRRSRISGSDSRSTALKRVRSPVSLSGRTSSQAKRPSNPTAGLGSSPCESGIWLNSRRGPANQGGATKGGRNQHGNKTQPVRGFDDLADLSSPEENQRSKGRGQRSGGGGKVSRRLEMSSDPAVSVVRSATPDTSDADLDDVEENPFSGELQIDEDATFVECPLCMEMFPADTINLHAAGCCGESSDATNQAGAFVQCPLCEDMFPEEIISQHASHCSL